MVATSKLPKLRATRARLDLSTQGNQQDRNSSSPDVFTVDAILYSTVALQEASHEEIDEACRSEMSKEMDTTSRDDGCDPIRWGNSRGLTVLECLDEMKKEIIKIKADNTASDLKATALDLKATALDLKVNTMEDELNTMKLIHTEYLEVRNRFLSMAKRDQLGTASPKDYQIIRHGKVLVHTGDALCDAMLYKKRLRRDDETFQTLYGMAWSRVLSDYANHKETLRVLSVHASIKASMQNPPLSFASSFRDFVSALLEGDGGTNYLCDELSKEAQAYNRFWKEYSALGLGNR